MPRRPNAARLAKAQDKFKAAVTDYIVGLGLDLDGSTITNSIRPPAFYISASTTTGSQLDSTMWLVGPPSRKPADARAIRSAENGISISLPRPQNRWLPKQSCRNSPTTSMR